MNIGYDATAIPPRLTGAGVYIKELIRALTQMDRTNRYFVFAQPAHLQDMDISYSHVQKIPLEFSSIPKRLLWEQTGLPALASSLHLDLLHSPHYTMPLRCPCKRIVTFHDMTFITMPEVHGRFKRIFFRNMMKHSGSHADRLLADSESTRQDMHRILGIDLQRIDTAPLAADDAYRPLAAAETEAHCAVHSLTPGRFLLFVGVLEPRKNVPALVRAYASVHKKHPDIPLVIAGKKGWMYDEIFAAVQQLGLTESVRFLGYIPREEQIGLYNGARLFVYPSQYEGFGLPVLEALQCGAPVLTSNLSSMPEVAGDAALLVSPQDEAGLANAMLQVLEDDHLAAQMKERGLERARQFSWQRCAELTLQAYETAAGVSAALSL